jgi:Niemann-Pick C1 protein
MKISICASTVALITIGVMSCYGLVLGLNQNVSLVEGSDTYNYFESLYTYGQAGPPAYLVFNNVNYTNPENLANMNLITAELATLHDTILAPIYSWVAPF